MYELVGERGAVVSVTESHLCGQGFTSGKAAVSNKWVIYHSTSDDQHVIYWIGFP